MEKLRKEKLKKQNKESLKKSIVKIIAVLVIVSLNLTGLSAIIETVAYYMDTEDSPQNIFSAASLDFSLYSPDNFLPEVMPDQSASRDINVINDGILGFQYTVQAGNFSGELCDFLNLEADLDGDGSEYTGSLTGFSYDPGEFSAPDDWQFIATLISSDPALENKTCVFDFVFDGVQIGGAGFYDQEVISNTVNSGTWTEPVVSDYSPIADSYVNEKSPDSNYGVSSELRVRSKNCPNPLENERTFIKFDFHFPAGAIINSAVLKLYMKDAPLEDRTYEARRVLGTWKERDAGPGDGIDWNNQAPAEIDITDSVPAGTADDVWLAWDVTSDVQDFADGDYVNYGWRVNDSAESDHTGFEAKFHSRESNNADKRPVLEITFTPPEVSTAYPVINEVYYDVAYLKGTDPGNEWVEIYNPTSDPVDISGWKICEKDGCDTIPSAILIPAHGFAIASGKNSTWETYWTLPSGAITIDLPGEKIGSNGLKDDGDRVILKNASDAVIGAMSYGSDDSQLNPPVPLSGKGKSLARIVKGYDTGSADDWIINTTPNPGTNPSINGVETVTFTSEGIEFSGWELFSGDEEISNDLPEEDDLPDPILETATPLEETIIIDGLFVAAPLNPVGIEEIDRDRTSIEIEEELLVEEEAPIVEEAPAIEQAPVDAPDNPADTGGDTGTDSGDAGSGDSASEDAGAGETVEAGEAVVSE